MERRGYPKPRVLILIAAHNVEKSIKSVVWRIPRELTTLYDVNVLIIDDASVDSTFAESYDLSKTAGLPFPVRAIFNPVHLGHGGSQKLGYHYAIEDSFDFVALLPSNGEVAPECLPSLLEPLRRGSADAVFGSRMRNGKNTITGGMPPWKFLGSRILTYIENRLLHASLSEFQSGYRVYSVAALRAIPFERNSNGPYFDTEVAIQLLIASRPIQELPVQELPIQELPIPKYCGGKIGCIGGIKYAVNVTTTALKARLQEMSLFYDRRFDCAPPETYSPYTPKLNYESTHTLALARVHPGSRVLDLGCAGGYLGSQLRRQKQCYVTGMDRKPVKRGALDEFQACDLEAGVPPIDPNRYDVVLLLDVIEHLNHPENFLEELRLRLALNPSLELMISTANIACFATRVMLLLGQFNYGPRGILDVTHTRLFTFSSLRRALVQSGFDILETKGVPAPYPLAIGDNFVSRALLAANRLLIRVSRGLFSYQIFMRVKPQPSLESLLATAKAQSRIRMSLMEGEVLAGAADR